MQTPKLCLLLANTRALTATRVCVQTLYTQLLAADIDVLNFTSTQLKLMRAAARVGKLSPLGVWNSLCHEHTLAFLNAHSGPDGYKSVQNKLHVSMSDMTEYSPTRATSITNVLVSEFTSNEDLVDAFLASAHIPIYGE